MRDHHSPSRPLATAAFGGFVVAWTTLVILPPVAFVRWREGRLAALSAPAVQREWERFRTDMREQSGTRGPVQRKVPKSGEPPERVWLRDHAAAVVAAWVVFVGLLGIVVGSLLRGALRTGTSCGRDVSGPGSGGP